MAIYNYDIMITFIFGIIIFIIRLFIRHKNKKESTKEVLQLLLGSFLISALFYGGISAIWFGFTGNLLFDLNLIISKELLITFGGVAMIGIGILTLYYEIKKDKEEGLITIKVDTDKQNDK